MSDSSPTQYLRIDNPGSYRDLDARKKAAIDAGFDGIEVSLGAAPAVKAEVVFANCTVWPADTAQEAINELLRRANDSGAHTLNLTLAAHQEQDRQPGAAPLPDVTSAAYRLLHDVRFEIERFGVRVALEAGANGHLISPMELRDLVDAVNSWAVGVCVDVERLARFSDPVEWIYLLGRRLHTIRLGDVTVQAHSALDVPVDFPSIDRSLDQIDFSSSLVVGGVGSPAEINDAAKHCLPHIKTADSIHI